MGKIKNPAKSYPYSKADHIPEANRTKSLRNNIGKYIHNKKFNEIEKRQKWTSKQNETDRMTNKFWGKAPLDPPGSLTTRHWSHRCTCSPGKNGSALKNSWDLQMVHRDFIDIS